MIEILWPLFPAALLLGIITSYTDVKYGKIRNKHLLYFMLFGIIIYSAFFLYNFINDQSLTFILDVGGEEISYSFLVQTITNFIAAVVIGVGIWIFNIWNAADAKLFITFALLIPATAYTNEYIRYFPSFVIIINALIIIMIFLLIQIIRKDRSLFKKSLFNLIKKPKEIYYNIQMVFIIEWAIAFLFTVFNIQQMTIFFIVGALFILLTLAKHLRKIVEKFNYIVILAIIFRFFIDFDYLFSVSFLIRFSIIVALFVFLRMLLEDVSEKAFSKKIHVKNLEPGMTTSQFLVDNGKKIILKKNDGKSIKGKNFIVPSIEGFTKEEIEKIQKAHKKGKLGFQYVEISTKTFFAPFLFSSVILTLLIGGSLLNFFI